MDTLIARIKARVGTARLSRISATQNSRGDGPCLSAFCRRFFLIFPIGIVDNSVMLSGFC